MIVYFRAIDALALLESFHHRLSSGKEEGRKRIQEDEAVEAVRAAVRAGILNDLGSGSHVDLCVIDAKKGFFQWRERLKPSASNDSTQPAPLRAVDIGQRLNVSSSAEEPSNHLRPRGISIRPLPLSSPLSDQA